MLQKAGLRAPMTPMPFPLNNLPYGVFSEGDHTAHMGVAIGDMIFDCHLAADAGLLELTVLTKMRSRLRAGTLSGGRARVWAKLRARLKDILAEGSSDQSKAESCLMPMDKACMHMPFDVAV